MISFAWAEVTTINSAVPRGEWAGVRSSTAQERRVVRAGRKDTCNTFLFKACGGFLRLIVSQDRPMPSLLRRMTIATAIRQALAGKVSEVENPFSCSVLAAAVALVPCVADELRSVAAKRRCENCSCVMRVGGPIDPDCHQWKSIAAELGRSKQRTAA